MILELVPDSPAKATMAMVVSVILAKLATIDPMTKTLLYLIAIDIVSGFIAAASDGKVSSDASYKGMGKKAMMLLLVGAAGVYNATQPLGFDARVIVAGFFSTTEFISILENAGRVGLPLPKALIDAVAKLNQR